MRQLNVEELKHTQLEILTYVADFCEQNGITYWIDSGTLLGAIRHGGYIPWDDDIDVGMLREDYDKFCECFNKGSGKYRVFCLENTPDFYLSHAKVCDTTTVLYEPDENGLKLSVNIDIFVYDNAPEDDNDVRIMYDTRDKYRRIYEMQNYKMSASSNVVKNVLKLARSVIYRACCPNAIQKMVDNSKKHSKAESTRVGNFTAYTRMTCHKRVFDSFVDVGFEGRMYKAPVGYDEWLRSFYGNYMELPPVEKQVSHHSFKAFASDDESSLK